MGFCFSFLFFWLFENVQKEKQGGEQTERKEKWR